MNIIVMSFEDCLNCDQENKICRNMLLTLAEFEKGYRLKNQVQEEFNFMDKED